MISKKKQYTACPKCFGNMKVRRNGSYKCRLCKREFSREEYIESVSQMLVDDIRLFNQLAERKAQALALKKWFEDQNKMFE